MHADYQISQCCVSWRYSFSYKTFATRPVLNSFQDYISVRSVLFYTNFKDNFKETQISIKAKLKCAKLMKLYHLSEMTLWVKSHNISIELGSLAWGEKRKWRFFQFFSENIEHLKKIIILYKSCCFTMHIRIFWLQIVEFDIFYHLEQSLWIFVFFHPFLFTCGRLPLKEC